VYDADQKKWVSLANDHTTTESDPQAAAAVRTNLPGFTGSSGGPVSETFTLPEKYAGQNAWIAVRYISDGSVNEPGVWLSGLTVGGTPVADATDLSTWK
jgi:immune inhibitor A